MESVKLRVGEDTIYYPDVMVACGLENEDPLVEDAPCLIVEVAAPSTEAIDRREKMVAYRKIPTLKAYLTFSQDTRRVERHWRDTSGEWFVSEATDAAEVPVLCPETKLSPADIHEGF